MAKQIIFTESQINKIFKYHKDGLSFRDIGKKFNCSHMTISYHINNNDKQLKQNRDKRKQLAKNKFNWKYNYLKDKSCAYCGESNPLTLQFDHKSKYNKTMDISKMISKNFSIKSIEKEVKKCRVLCANCHQIKTFKNRNTYFYQIVKGEGKQNLINAPLIKRGQTAKKKVGK